MTVAADIPSFIQIPGNGSATSFAFPFKIFQASDLVVGFITSSGYTQQTSGFAVQNVDVNGGGNVVFATAPPVGTTVDIRSVTPKVQDTEFANLGAFLPEDHTEAFDRLTRMVQDLYRLCYTFGIHGPDQEGTTWPALPVANQRANNGLVFDVNGLPTIGTLTTQVLTQSLIGQFLWPQTQAEITAGITPTSYAYPFGDMRRYGVQTGSGNDNTAIFQAVFGMFKVSGGTMLFQPGEYAGYIDLSGSSNAEVIVEGNGAQFYPYTSTPTQSCCVFANNSGSSVSSVGTSNSPSTYSGTNFTFRNCNFYGRKIGSSTAGDVNAAVGFYGASAEFWNCSFNYGQVAGFYACYGQYNEFYSCSFNLCTYSNNSAGCLLDSHSVSYASNEVLFSRCKFYVNSNGLWLKGCLVTRIRDCSMQGNTGTIANGCAAIKIDQDSTNGFTTDTIIDGGWFEINSGYHVYEVAGARVRLINNNTFTSGGQNSIYFTHCYDVSVINHQDYDGSLLISFNHPNTTEATNITFRGNSQNIAAPTFSLLNTGAKTYDMYFRGSFTWTLTGCTTSPTGTVRYSIQGDQVCLEVASAISGTSNSTTTALTGAPAFLTPVRNQAITATVNSNGTVQLGAIGISNAGVFTLYSDVNGDPFGSSGTKALEAFSLSPYGIAS